MISVTGEDSEAVSAACESKQCCIGLQGERRLPMFPGTYVPRYRCSPNLCSPVPMFPGTYVPRYRSSPVFVGYFNSGQWHRGGSTLFANPPPPPPTPYDSRLGLCLGYIFRVVVRVGVRLELRSVLRLWLGCGLWLGPYG